MNRHGPCESQRILRKRSQHLLVDLAGFLVLTIADILPHHAVHLDIPVVTTHKNLTVVDVRDHTNLAVIEPSRFLVIIAHKHHTRTDLERQNLLCRIDVFRKIFLDVRFEHMRFVRQSIQLPFIQFVCQSIVGRQCNMEVLIRVLKPRIVPRIQQCSTLRS